MCCVCASLVVLLFCMFLRESPLISWENESELIAKKDELKKAIKIFSEVCVCIT